MLQQVAFNQMFLSAKMSAALKAYLQYKETGNPQDPGNDSDSDSGGGSGNRDENSFSLKDGDGPYEPRIDTNNGEFNFSLVVSVSVKPELAEPLYRLVESGAIKLKDILTGSDFSGITLKTEDPALNGLFRIENDKSGDPAIVYDYYPEDINMWHAEPNGPTDIFVNVILSKAGFKDAVIKLHLLYNDSLFVAMMEEIK